MGANGQPKDLLLVNRCSPGDVLMMTAAVRDLHRAKPRRYRVAVDTQCPDLWLHNPHVVPVSSLGPSPRRIDCSHPPLLNRCNGQPRHYIESIHDLLSSSLEVNLPLTQFAPDLHLSPEEGNAPPFGIQRPYWVIVAGGKHDVTIKWWPTKFYQQVVDALAGKVQFVQTGASRDHHPPLNNVINTVGQGRLRDLVRLIYHADGVVCPVTCAMHLAAAFEKPCVVIAGGREPPHWEMYPGHQFLHTIGQLSCCASSGCWKARVVPLRDGDRDRDSNVCLLPNSDVEAESEMTGTPGAGASGAPGAYATCMTMIQPQDVCRAVERYLARPKHTAPMLTNATALEQVRQVARSHPEYPGAPGGSGGSGGFSGRGIVIPGGGKYFPSAWVCIRLLRYVGCTLPIELWHLGPAEMNDEMRRLVKPLGVDCVDAYEVRKKHPARRLGGWELKPYAIIHSRFKEVLLLDADNVAVSDPEALFETPQYQKYGAVFWPDYTRLSSQRDIWRLTGVPYRDEEEFESGQALVDKSRCWKSLLMTMWMNEHSDYWYRHIYGDKDTFHFGWRIMGQDYAMPRRGIHSLWGVMCQHDFDGRRIFQHRNAHKWRVDCPNPHVAGFIHEDECHLAMKELEQKWQGRPSRPFQDDEASETQRRVARDICRTRWVYRRVGHGERSIMFGLDGMIHEGQAGCERTWNLKADQDQTVLAIHGQDGKTCEFRFGDDGIWRGQWLIHERMKVELIPQSRWSERAYENDVANEVERAIALELCGRQWTYRRIGFDERLIQFGLDGTIIEGNAAMEMSWGCSADTECPAIHIYGREGRTCTLKRRSPDLWDGEWAIFERMPIELAAVRTSDPAKATTRGIDPDDKKQLTADLCRKRWLYRRVGHGSRHMTFLPDGRVDDGKAECERSWQVQVLGHSVRLFLIGEGGVTGYLDLADGGRWVGRWLINERAPIELVPLGDCGPTRLAASIVDEQLRADVLSLVERPLLLRRVGRDKRHVILGLNGQLLSGSTTSQRYWGLERDGEGKVRLWLSGDNGRSSVFSSAGDGRWYGQSLDGNGHLLEFIPAPPASAKNNGER